MKLWGAMGYWNSLDRLVSTHRLVIDGPKGSRHKLYHDFVYPLDHGYLDYTISGDGIGVDVWVGSVEDETVTAVICSVDLLKTLWRPSF